MQTINISLPEKLKDASQKLIDSGYFVSFSDLVRSALRDAIKKNKYDLWAEEAVTEHKKGKALVLKEKTDIDRYIDSLH